MRQIRERRHLSQEAAAALAGVHRNYWGSCERGERNVSLHNILKIAKALRVPAAKLFLDW